MPNACPQCRSPWNLMQTLPFNGTVSITCGDCGWAGTGDDLEWLSADEVDDE